MDTKGNHIVFTGLSGIPESPNASIQRIIQLGKALASAGWKVTYLNRLPLYRAPGSTEEFFPGLKTIRIEDALAYRKSSENRFGRLWWKVIAFPAETIKLFGINRKNRINILFIYSQYFSLVLLYSALARLMGWKTILSYVEFRSAIVSRKGFFIRLNDFLFDRFAYFLTNAVNPISHPIEQYVASRCPGKRQLRIPALCDFSLFRQPDKNENTQLSYFLFCGNAGYFEVIQKTIHSFLSISDRKGIRLRLVVGGNTNQLGQIRKEIGDSKEISLVSDIQYSELVLLYSNALALVIPLRDTVQDNYRFPHKISEYTASKRPIISTNIGEIPFYFKDRLNAILCSDTSCKALTNAMEWAINNQDKLICIGEEGFLTGTRYFSHKNYEQPLNEFMSGLLIH